MQNYTKQVETFKKYLETLDKVNKVGEEKTTPHAQGTLKLKAAEAAIKRATDLINCGVSDSNDTVKDFINKIETALKWKHGVSGTGGGKVKLPAKCETVGLTPTKPVYERNMGIYSYNPDEDFDAVEEKIRVFIKSLGLKILGGRDNFAPCNTDGHTIPVSNKDYIILKTNAKIELVLKPVEPVETEPVK